MMTSLKEAIEALKLRVRFNLTLVHEVEEEIKEILKEPVSAQRSEKLNERFIKNKKLMNENEESLKIQRSLINYLEKYHDELSQFPEVIEFNSAKEKNTLEVSTKIEIKREDYFEITINKSIEYDNLHPYFKDERFANDLLSYFIEIEDYEMCARLSKITKNETAQ